MKMWTWMGKSTGINQASVYGTPLVESATGWPGSRYGAHTWLGNDGCLWLYGGYGYNGNVSGEGFLNDFWRYNPASGHWTYMAGTTTVNDSGNYGQQGVAASTNMPRGKVAAATWYTGDTLWVFGGAAMNYYPYNYSDLWKYEFATGYWTWMKGPSTSSAAGVYGTVGVEAPGNMPGSRNNSASWVGDDGMLYLYAGNGRSPYSHNTTGPHEDLWRYNPATNNWTWLKGSSNVYVATMPPVKGVEGPNIHPGYASTPGAAKAPDGRVWIYGGGAYDMLFRYNPATNNYTWIEGTTDFTADTVYDDPPLNRPGERTGAATWEDNAGNLWLFGGNGYIGTNSGAMADLWKADISPRLLFTPRSLSVAALDKQVIGPISVYVSNSEGTGTLSYNLDPKAQWVSVSPTGASVTTVPVTHSISIASEAIPQVNSATNILATYTDTGTTAVVPVRVSISPLTITLNKSSLQGPASEGEDFGMADFTIRHNGTSGVLPCVISAAQEWIQVQDTNISITSAPTTVRVYFNTDALPPATHNGSIQLAVQEPGYSLPNLPVTLKVASTFTGVWTWMGGSGTVGQYETWGTKGQPAPGNNPGGRRGVAAWSDSAGGLWLFGGSIDNGGNLYNGYQRNDMWKFDSGSNMWSWVGGTQDINLTGVYGTRLMAATGNTPGARLDSATCVGKDGRFWLYGGVGFGTTPNVKGALNDLWCYDAGSSNWTWVSGSTNTGYTAPYGTLGVEDPANQPGSRVASTMWTDTSGTLWLFGGSTDNGGSLSEAKNDLWKFSPDTSNWTWIAGPSTGGVGNYGTIGIGTTSTLPGSRWYAHGWADDSGNLWLFGGGGPRPTSGNGRFNDLWKYNIETNIWTWISGQNTYHGQPTYGTQGVPGPTVKPGSIVDGMSTAVGGGDFWVFGGYGEDQNLSPSRRNGLWKFRTDISQWTWIKGDTWLDPLGVYGELGVPKGYNMPGGRDRGAAWSDPEGNIWVYGGTGFGFTSQYGVLNDMWRFSVPVRSRVDFDEAVLY